MSTIREVQVTVLIEFPAPGTEIRTGLVSDEYPGLAVTPSMFYDFSTGTNYEGGWSVTHVPSGIALCHALPDQEVAVEAMRQLTQIADWTQGQAEIEALPDSVKAEARSIVRALRVAYGSFSHSPVQ